MKQGRSFMQGKSSDVQHPDSWWLMFTDVDHPICILDVRLYLPHKSSHQASASVINCLSFLLFAVLFSTFLHPIIHLHSTLNSS